MELSKLFRPSDWMVSCLSLKIARSVNSPWLKCTEVVHSISWALEVRILAITGGRLFLYSITGVEGRWTVITWRLGMVKDHSEIMTAKIKMIQRFIKRSHHFSTER